MKYTIRGPYLRGDGNFNKVAGPFNTWEEAKKVHDELNSCGDTDYYCIHEEEE